MAGPLVPKSFLEKAARRFRILGEPTRLQILNLLHAGGEMNVQELVAATGCSQANVSKHLRVMMDEELIARRQEGLFAFFKITDPSISGMCLLVCGQISAKEAAEDGKE